MLKTVSSITNAIGALNYKGTWNASTNTPTITSSVGVKGDYYVVSVGGTTTIDGISNWGVGDWITFNGSVWQRVEGGADLNGVNLSVSGTTTLSGLTASTALALDASKDVVSVTNTGTGNNVLATGPSISDQTVTNYTESVVAIGTVGASHTIDLTNGTVQTATLTASTATTFTMPTATAGKSFVLLLKQAAATGNGTATFTGVKFNGSGTPVVTATAGKMDIFSFFADGTNWYGSVSQGYTP
jgi:hypothetical protein